MNARKIFIILGSVCLIAIVAVVVMALFLLQKSEGDKRRNQTEAAREAAIRKAREKREGATTEPEKDAEDFKDVEPLTPPGNESST